jgi:hypothetical protein
LVALVKKKTRFACSDGFGQTFAQLHPCKCTNDLHKHPVTAHLFRINFFTGFREVKNRLQQKKNNYNINKKFWVELIAYFPFTIHLIRHGPHTKHYNSSSIVACPLVAEGMFIEPLPSLLPPLIRLAGVTGDTHTARRPHERPFIFSK